MVAMRASEVSTTSKIHKAPIWDGKHDTYETWAIRSKAYFSVQGWSEIILYDKPRKTTNKEEEEEEEQRANEGQAFFHITRSH